MTRRNDALSYAPISVLVAIMLVLYLVFMLALVPPLAEGAADADALYPNSAMVNMVVVNVFFALALTSFLRASFTRPGAVPSLHPWDPDCPPSFGNSPEMEKALAEKGFQHVRGLERKMDGRARFCRMCGRYKPDRAHHSSNMGQCILEMDHYCPWIRNCVGYKNKKYFFLLVVYGAMSLIGYCVALGPRFVKACQKMTTVLDFFIVFTWILAVLLAVACTTFAFFHMWLMAKAFTTIEFCEKRRADESKRTAQGFKVAELYEESPYDLGVYHNVSHVLGPWYFWLVPARWGMPDDVAAGCIFDVNPRHTLYKTAIGSWASKAAQLGGGPASVGEPTPGPAADAQADANRYAQAGDGWSAASLLGG